MMPSFVVLASWLLSLAELCFATPGTLSLTTYKNHEKHREAVRRRSLSRRDGPFDVTLGNYPFVAGGFYYVNATVGSNEQLVKLDIDTGSSDVWMFGVGSCDLRTSLCLGGAFNEDDSSTFEIVSEDTFSIRYFTKGSGVEGDYIKDSFAVGGTRIKQLTMGLARSAKSVMTGIMGIGFAANEAIVGQQQQAGDDTPEAYPNFIDRLLDDGVISTRSYSVWLNDINAETGSIIFGGYDKSKYEGELAILPIQRDSTTDSFSSFSVVLSSIGVTDDSGSTVLSSKNTPNVVVLDTGTAFTLVPSDILAQVVNYFGAIYSETYGGYLIECDLSGATGTLDYQFGGSKGPVISVPFDQLAVPLYDDNFDQIYDDDDKAVCRLGLDSPTETGEPLLFGDTFLRSAYVVYDLDSLQIGLAQTKFNASDSNIVTIKAGKGENLPGSVVKQGTSIEQTATGVIRGGGAQTGLISASKGKIQSAGSHGDGVSALTGVRTTYTNRATNIPGSTPGSSSSQRTSSPANLVRPFSGISWSSVAMQGILALGGMMAGALLVMS